MAETYSFCGVSFLYAADPRVGVYAGMCPPAAQARAFLTMYAASRCAPSLEEPPRSDWCGRTKECDSAWVACLPKTDGSGAAPYSIFAPE
ncbi:hypothetical protein GCM10018966_099220 [Streptomyces yanii]